MPSLRCASAMAWRSSRCLALPRGATSTRRPATSISSSSFWTMGRAYRTDSSTSLTIWRRFSSETWTCFSNLSSWIPTFSGKSSPHRRSCTAIRRAPKRLRDVVEAANEILSYTEGKTFDDYVNDRGLRLMVERLFEIVGEAMNQAVTDEPEFQDEIPEARRVVGMRNRIIHGYDVVRHDIVWDSVQNQVRPLRDRIMTVLEARGWS